MKHHKVVRTCKQVPGLDDVIHSEQTKVTAVLVFEILTVLISPLVATVVLDGKHCPPSLQALTC